MLRPGPRLKSPLVLKRSNDAGGSPVSLNLAVLTNDGMMLGPNRSSHPRTGMPSTVSLHELSQLSSGMLLPSSHCSSGVIPPGPSGSSTTAFPQQPSPAAASGQVDAVTQVVVGWRVQVPRIL